MGFVTFHAPLTLAFGPETLILLAVGVAALAASYFLIPKPKNKSRRFEPTTLSERGSYVPLLIGRRRVGAVFAWAGRRKSSKSSGGGKGGVLGGGGGGAKEYKEDGWHLLCVGPATKLYGICENNKLIWEGPINSTTSPSGTTVSTGRGSFTIYWGELNQPINEDLALDSAVGVRSRWPLMCYIQWTGKNLGGTPTWPQLEYDLETSLDGDGSVIPLAEARIPDGAEIGTNPAFMLFMLLTGNFPHGVGLSADDLDETSLQAISAILDTESIPGNVVVNDGDTIDNLVKSIMADTGMMMPMHEGRLVFKLIRDTTGESLPTITEDMITQPETEIDIDTRVTVIDRIVYTFNDIELQYKVQDVKIDNDSSALEHGRFTEEQNELVLPTDIGTAIKIADRRSQEAFANLAKFSFAGVRSPNLLIPGMAAEVENVGTVRILSVKRDTFTPRVDLECILDSLAVTESGAGQDDNTAQDSTLDPAEDTDFTWIQAPESFLSRDTVPSGMDLPSIAILVFRHRAHDQIEGAFIHASIDAADYQVVGLQNTHASGGIMSDALSASTDDIVATGPTFEASSFDILDVLDLSSSEQQWKNGRQLCVIDSEVFFLEHIDVVAVSDWAAATVYSSGSVVQPTSSGKQTGLRYVRTAGGTSGASEPDWPETVGDTVVDNGVTWRAHHYQYTLKNMIRARFNTVKASHSINDRVYIINQADLVVISDSIITPGVSLCVKTQPFTNLAEVDVGLVTPVCQFLDSDVINATFLSSLGGVDIVITHTGDGIRF